MNIPMSIFQIFNSVSAIYIYSLFFDAFSEKRIFKGRVAVLAIIASIWSGALICISIAPIRSLIIMLLIIVLSMTYRNKWYKSLLLSVLIYILPALIEIIVAMLLMLFGIEASASDQNSFIIIGTLVSKILTLTCVQFIRIGKHKFGNISVWYYIAFGVLGVCSTLTILILIDYIFINSRTHMKIITLIAVWMITAVNLTVFYVIDRINKLHISEHNYIVSKPLLEEQRLYYETVLNDQKEINKIRHDIKNSLIGILSEIESNNIINAKQNIKNIFEDIDNGRSVPLCRDVSLNTIFIIKQKEAVKKGIELSVDEQGSAKINIDPIDLSVLLGNAIDNAIEACDKLDNVPKYIDIFISANSSNLIINIKNPVANKIETENLTTTKEDKRMHGIGLTRIKEITEKYNGILSLECSDEFFEFNLVISNDQAV